MCSDEYIDTFVRLDVQLERKSLIMFTFQSTSIYREVVFAKNLKASFNLLYVGSELHFQALWAPILLTVFIGTLYVVKL